VPCPLNQPRGACDWLHHARVDPAGADLEDPEAHVLAAAAAAAAVAMIAVAALACPQQNLVAAAGVFAQR